MGKDKIIIGLTGSFGSGCSKKVAPILRDKFNFKIYSVADILEEEAKDRNISIETKRKKEKRKILQDIGNEMRKEDIERGNGGGVLIRKIMELAQKEADEKDIVINSIKNPCEVAELKRYPNAYLIAIDASSNIRWERVKDETYEGDLNQFREDDNRDKDEGLKCKDIRGQEYYYGQQVQKCIDLADILIDNDENFKTPREKEDFEREIEGYIKLILNPGSRLPTAMEVLMNNAYCISLQSQCLKRRVGAIIVEQEPEKEEYYIKSSGYNKVPEGNNECRVEYKECYRDRRKREVLNEFEYCPSCGEKIKKGDCKCSKCKTDLKKFISYGKGLDVCRALHAEERAILQVSYLGGTSLRNTTLYTTTFPCALCAKQIIAVGISRICYVEAYPMEEAKDMLKSAEVELVKFKGVKAQAFYKLFKDYE